LQEVTCKINVGNPKELKKIEFQIEDELTKELTSVTNKAQSKKLDVFGFGKLLYDNHPELWRKYKKDWAEHFSDAKVKTSVNITLETVGARVESIHEQ
jgi:spore germination protein KC